LDLAGPLNEPILKIEATAQATNAFKFLTIIFRNFGV